MAAELRPGNVHSADGVLDFITPLVARYRSRFKLFWFRGDAAFALPDVYDYCEKEHVTYFIRLPMNYTLRKIMEPEINTRPVGRPPKSGVKVRTSSFTTGLVAGKNAAGWCAGGVAQRRIIPQGGLYRHQFNLEGMGSGESLQWPSQCGKPDQGSQEYPALGQDQLPQV